MQRSEPLTEAPELPANRLRELREAAGLKVYDISAMLRVDPSTVWRWEKSLAQIPDAAKLALAARYGVSVSHLMGWDEPAAA